MPFWCVSPCVMKTKRKKKWEVLEIIWIYRVKEYGKIIRMRDMNVHIGDASRIK